jgi:hypothetical protein
MNVRALVIASCVLAALVGCGDDDDGSPTSTATAAQALPPVIADLGELDGTTVDVGVGGTIDLTGDDETFTDWTATIDDPSVVSFTPGRDDGSAQFNPGLQATAVGTTDVTLTNSVSGESVTFTVVVK